MITPSFQNITIKPEPEPLQQSFFNPVIFSLALISLESCILIWRRGELYTWACEEHSSFLYLPANKPSDTTQVRAFPRDSLQNESPLYEKSLFPNCFTLFLHDSRKGRSESYLKSFDLWVNRYLRYWFRINNKVV